MNIQRKIKAIRKSKISFKDPTPEVNRLKDIKETTRMHNQILEMRMEMFLICLEEMQITTIIQVKTKSQIQRRIQIKVMVKIE